LTNPFRAQAGHVFAWDVADKPEERELLHFERVVRAGRDS
jgi:hypothetical protein